MQHPFSMNEVTMSYIKLEIQNRYEYLSPEAQSHSFSVGLNFFQSLISFDQAKNIFLQITGSVDFIEKLNSILHSGEGPVFEPQKSPKKKNFTWTEGEDLRLISAVMRYSAKDWKSIADFVGPHRNSSQCNQRWIRILDPSINRKQWTPEEDSKLREAVGVLGKKSWSQITKVIFGRTDVQCRYRYNQLTKGTDLSGSRSATESDIEVPFENRLPISDFSSGSSSIFPSDFHSNFHSSMNSSLQSNFQYYLDSDFQPRTEDPEIRYFYRFPPALERRKSIQKPHSFTQNSESQNP